MSNRALIWMTAAVLTGILLLFGLNLMTILNVPQERQPFIGHNEVRGLAIKHHKLFYTLNFDQQNKVIDFFNQSAPLASSEGLNWQQSSIESLIIYQFDGKDDLIVTPIGYVDNQLLYMVPQWNPNGYLIETSGGRLKELVEQTYAP